MPAKKCPGQDTRYWKPEDIFEIKCGSCGTMVEFFKDDVQLKCYKCGTTIENPKIKMGCAEWCQYADECLGTEIK
ncbi:MAG: hypothetical protein GY754_14070 [bacterium]|nr:hypothetical protein [bacterium]